MAKEKAIDIAMLQYPQRHYVLPSVWVISSGEERTHRFTMTNGNSCCDWAGDDAEECRTICEDHANVSPSVGEKLGECKGSLTSLWLASIFSHFQSARTDPLLWKKARSRRNIVVTDLDALIKVIVRLLTI